MGNNIKTGEEGEMLAVEYLQAKGFEILQRNYRSARSEIDIIAKDGPVLVFVEVKLRSMQGFGFPEEAVNDKKWEMIMQGAESYIESAGWSGAIRFDIVSIVKKKKIEIVHFEDALS